MDDEDNPNLLAQPSESNKVLKVSRLPKTLSVNMIFNLFSFYGDVQKIKILNQPKYLCLVQYSSNTAASNAMKFLEGLKLADHPISVTFSRFPEILISTDESSAQSFTAKDQRPAKNRRFLCAPTSIVHIANIGERAESIKNLLSNFYRDEKIEFKILVNNTGMLAKFESIKKAIDCLMRFHNHSISHVKIKLSFTKSSF
jgi:RNA recognition motif-containing protein